MDFSFLFAPGGYARQCARFRAGRLVGRAGWTADDRADLEADILVRVVKGLQGYDPARGRVEPLVASIVKAAARDLLRRRRSRKRAAGRAVEAPYDAPDRRPWNEDLRIDLDDLLAALPARLRADAVGLMRGDQVADLAAAQGRSRSGVHRDLGRLRAWLTAAGIADYRPPTKKRDEV